MKSVRFVVVSRRLRQGCAVVCVWGAGALQAGLMSDSFEAGLGAWSAAGGWGITAADAHSPTRSVTDSPGSFYANNTDAAVTLASPLNLSAAARPAVRFYHRHAVEPDYDWAVVEASTDGGASWTGLVAYTGTQATWRREQLDLGAFAGQPSVKLRFRLLADESVVMDGWYVDDVLVGEAPAAPALTNVAAQGVSAVRLAWAASESADVVAYRIYRSGTAGFDSGDAVWLGSTPAGTTTFVDAVAAPKTRFYYRVAAVSSEDLHAESNEGSVLLPAGMDYPFLDNGEAGGSYWTPEGTWALSDEASASGAHAWSDSPGGNYTNAINTSLVLSAPLDLRGTVNPTLCFLHRHAFAGGDSGNAEVSSNGGVDWTTLRSYTGSTSGLWRRERFSLAGYTNSANALVRFRITTDTATTADGWTVDDISVAESPATINAPVVSDVESHALRLTWAASSDPLFSHYAVFRSTASGVGINSALVTNIHDAAVTTCRDTGLALDTDYYYRVYAVNGYGTYSADGTERYVHTANHPVPYADAFEDGAQGWNVTGQWAVSPGAGIEGGACLTDSPGTTYVHNQSTYAQTSVNLSGTAWPVLRFRDRYALGTGDWIRLEVSPNGTSWTRLYGVYGQGARAEWLEQEVDLSAWKGQGNVRLRFTLAADNSAVTTADGWFIDDVSVVDNPPAAIPYPFYEGFEDAGWTSRWTAASWLALTNSPLAGASALADRASAATRMSPDTQHYLALAGELDLTAASNPQIVFWARGTLPSYSQLRLYVSRDGGLSWPYEYADARVDNGANLGWTRRQASLAEHAGRRVRLRFMLESFYGEIPAGGLTLDGLVVKDRPAGSMLQSPAPHLKSVDLTWTPSTLGAGFKRYELYRSADATVTTADTPVFSTTNLAELAFTDYGPEGGLNQGSLYYYGLFTVDADESYSAVSTATVWTQVQSVGFTNAMEDMALLDRTAGSRWGAESNYAHSGSACIADSPGIDYPVSQGTTYLRFCVDLSTAAWPVLRFHDRYAMGAGDWMAVEVSVNESSWSRVYGVYGAGTRTAWREQAIDLSPWKGQPNVRIRFGLGIDGNATTVADGWAFDDLSVTDLGDARKPYPFYDGFEGGASEWVSSLWTPAQGTAYQGNAEVRNGGGVNLMSDMVYTAALGGAIDLTSAVNPTVTFWAKGSLVNYTQVRLQVSLNGGVSWTELSTCNINTGASLPNWTKFQASLGAHVGKTIRLRLYTETFYGTAPVASLAIDAFGVGEEAPEAPDLVSPANLDIVPTVTPTLVISNAFDCQTDPLSYRFEVYSDAALSNLVAIVPVLASGVGTTAWTVTPALADDAQYWWRCRSIDTGDHASAWSETGTFFVDLVNHAPTAPLIVSPYAGATMPDANGYFIWFASGDADLGDAVAGYRLQIAADAAFSNVLVDAEAASQPAVVLAQLRALPGCEAVALNARYYWRVRAVDLWGEPSAWTATSFIYGTLVEEPPPGPVTVTGITFQNGVVRLGWTPSAHPVRIEFSPRLVNPEWTLVPGAAGLSTTGHSFNAVSSTPQGFYRVVVE